MNENFIKEQIGSLASAAFIRGCEAYNECDGEEDCPYPAGTVEARDWFAGFQFSEAHQGEF